MRIAIIAPGLHRVQRGAEVALEAVGRELARIPNVEVTLFGSGQMRQEEPYCFIHADNVRRENFEHWPKVPVLRNEYVYEELTFLSSLITKFNPNAFDVTITCSYPFMNWWLRRGHNQPVHIYVTQNGDHPAQSGRSEYAWFDCDGLVCTNQEYFERNQESWNCALITNGVDPNRFSPGAAQRQDFGLPIDSSIALMVSALIPSKRVLDGIRAAAQIPDLHLVICGDGPERGRVSALGHKLMPGRIHLLKLPYNSMPDVYRAADVFLHMSMDEPFGNVYLEALATGLPIVAHDNKVSRWILEDTSTLVDTTDVNDVAQGIRDSLAKQANGDIARRRDLVERRFTWQSISRQYFSFLQSVTQS